MGFCLCTFVILGRPHTARVVALRSHFGGARWTVRLQRTPSELYNADCCTVQRLVLGDVPLHCALSPVLSSSPYHQSTFAFWRQRACILQSSLSTSNMMCVRNGMLFSGNEFQDEAISTRSLVDEFKHFMSSIHLLVLTVRRRLRRCTSLKHHQSDLILHASRSLVKIPHGKRTVKNSSFRTSFEVRQTRLWACRWAFLADSINVSSQTGLDRPENWKSDVGTNSERWHCSWNDIRESGR